MVDGFVLLIGQIAESAEDADAGDDASESVDQADDERVAEYAVVVFVVAGEGDHRSEGDSDRVEVLRRRVHPHLAIFF